MKINVGDSNDCGQLLVLMWMQEDIFMETLIVLLTHFHHILEFYNFDRVVTSGSSNTFCLFLLNLTQNL